MKSKLVASSMFLTLAVVFLFVIVKLIHAQTPAQRVVIVAKRYDFIPGDVAVKKGVPVTLVLSSEDVPHGLKFKELNIVLNVKKGETKEITFTPETPGTYIGQCSVFCGSGHGAMKMTLHVTE